jgi:cytochrome P450 family 6
LVPNFLKKLDIPLSRPEVDEFFFNLVRQTIDYREKNKNYERKDFMQMLIQLKNQGYLSANKDEDPQNKEFKKLPFNQVVAQAFLFFVAGFDSTSSTMNLCLIELCKNPKIQQKVQEEIDRNVDGELTYESLSELKYLECCIDETLRKHSINSALTRLCTKDYKINGTNLIIEAGRQIMIPVAGLHHDPNIYENPMEFKPERFLNSSTGTDVDIKGLYYLPFGDGPRKIILNFNNFY